MVKSIAGILLVAAFCFWGVQANAGESSGNDIVKVVMKDGRIIKGELLGQDGGVLTILGANGKSQDINVSSIRKVFNAKGQAVDLSGQSGSPREGAPQASGSSIPQYFGVYVVSENKLIELKTEDVTTVFGLIVGGNSDRGMAVDGMAGNPGTIISDQNPSFIVYQNGVDPRSLSLSPLQFTSQRTANQFNIINTDPRFFANVYQKDYNAPVAVNLWQPNGKIELRIAALPNNMFKFIPSGPLAPGKYAIYFDKSLHNMDIVFTASPGRKSSAYYFQVGDGGGAANSPESPASGDAPEAPSFFGLKIIKK